MGFRSTLYDLEAGHGARFGTYQGWEIAEDFGDPRSEYQAVREGAGLLDVCYAGKVAVSDRDRVRYLNNMLSNDIKNLAPGRGCYATLLTHQGRMESDVFVYASGEEIRLECSPAGIGRLLETLKKYVVADKVAIDDRTEHLGILSIQGPDSLSRLEPILERPLSMRSPLDHQTFVRSSGHWTVVRRNRTGMDGYDLWVPAPDLPQLWHSLVHSRKISPVGHTALNWLRTEAGIPWYGIDMDDKTLPMEMGLFEALSMTKGCYRGQEIVARVLHRGHLDRRLGAITVDNVEPPSKGSDVRREGSRIGEITSSILSPRLGKPLALAILKTEFLSEGTLVQVICGDTASPGRVVKVPLE